MKRLAESLAGEAKIDQSKELENLETWSATAEILRRKEGGREGIARRSDGTAIPRIFGWLQLMEVYHKRKCLGGV